MVRRIDDMGWVHAVLLVALWRGTSELLEQRRSLGVAGVLDARIAATRAARIDRALRRLGLAGAAHAVSHVGTARRSTSVPGLPPRPAIDWGGLIEDAREQARSRDRVADPSGTRVPAWANLLAATGAALTLAALLRPLADVAPWLAVAGVALALAGLAAARRG